MDDIALFYFPKGAAFTRELFYLQQEGLCSCKLQVPLGQSSFKSGAFKCQFGYKYLENSTSLPNLNGCFESLILSGMVSRKKIIFAGSRTSRSDDPNKTLANAWTTCNHSSSGRSVDGDLKVISYLTTGIVSQICVATFFLSNLSP